ncbi:hypothetical protein NPIL_72361 [Nephila pilipes]|uniref:Uncharacterized protein n=1 Tax=Nephila pilipes TaxID=299642 RepID=A0A8X6NIU5_NEPPI|nr:hypothetical protein NPIL_72361 [Nephila pilipes]
MLLAKPVQMNPDATYCEKSNSKHNLVPETSKAPPLFQQRIGEQKCLPISVPYQSLSVKQEAKVKKTPRRKPEEDVFSPFVLRD